MEIIKFIKCILKVGGILPVFSNGKQSFIGDFWKIIKMFIVIFPSAYTTITLIICGFVYIEDISRSTISFYQGFGFAMGVIMHLYMWSQAKAIQNLFNNIENIINMSKFNNNNNNNNKKPKKNISYLRNPVFYLIHFIQGIDRSPEFGQNYEKTDKNITKWTKLASKIWAVAIVSLSIRPYIAVLNDYLTGRYTFQSWKMLYENSL